MSVNDTFLPLPAKWLLELLKAARASSQLFGGAVVLQVRQ